jgi:transposase
MAFKTGREGRWNNPFSKVDVDELKRLFDEGVMIIEIAKRFGVAKGTIHTWIRYLGWCRPRKRPDLPEWNKLTKKYVGENNPAYGYRKLSWASRGVLKKLYSLYGEYASMGRALGVGEATVQKAFVENKIPVRKGRLCKFSKELLYDLYWHKGMTLGRIGELLGISYNTIVKVLNGVEYRSGISTRWEKKRNKYDWGNVREVVRERDGFECQMCSKSELSLKRKLSIHHISYDISENCVSNLVALCSVCHSRTNGGVENRKKWRLHFEKRLAEKYDYSYGSGMIEGGGVALERAAAVQWH